MFRPTDPDEAFPLFLERPARRRDRRTRGPHLVSRVGGGVLARRRTGPPDPPDALRAQPRLCGRQRRGDVRRPRGGPAPPRRRPGPPLPRRHGDELPPLAGAQRPPVPRPLGDRPRPLVALGPRGTRHRLSGQHERPGVPTPVRAARRDAHPGRQRALGRADRPAGGQPGGGRRAGAVLQRRARLRRPPLVRRQRALAPRKGGVQADRGGVPCAWWRPSPRPCGRWIPASR